MSRIDFYRIFGSAAALFCSLFPAGAMAQNESVFGNLCVGLDCTTSETFGLSVLKIKDINNRIFFSDPSSSPGFPSGDWQISLNSSLVDGQDFFAIQWMGTNADSGTAPSSTPFLVEGAAGDNALYVTASDYVGLGTATPQARLHVMGDARVEGALYQLSSRSAKTSIEKPDPETLLALISELEVGFWRYARRGDAARHFGPTAEAFHAAFGLGEDERHISVADMAGIALGAVQALEQRTNALQEQILSRDATIADLTRRLERLESQLEDHDQR